MQTRPWRTRTWVGTDTPGPSVPKPRGRTAAQLHPRSIGSFEGTAVTPCEFRRPPTGRGTTDSPSPPSPPGAHYRGLSRAGGPYPPRAASVCARMAQHGSMVTGLYFLVLCSSSFPGC